MASVRETLPTEPALKQSDDSVALGLRLGVSGNVDISGDPAGLYGLLNSLPFSTSVFSFGLRPFAIHSRPPTESKPQLLAGQVFPSPHQQSTDVQDIGVRFEQCYQLKGEET
jgi:hypothetical protein